MVRAGTFGRGRPATASQNLVPQVSTTVDEGDNQFEIENRARNFINRKIQGKRTVFSFEPPEVQARIRLLLDNPEIQDAVSRGNIARREAAKRGFASVDEFAALQERSLRQANFDNNLGETITFQETPGERLRRAIGKETPQSKVTDQIKRAVVSPQERTRLAQRDRALAILASRGELSQVEVEEEQEFRQFEDDIASAANLEGVDTFGAREIRPADNSFRKFRERREPIRAGLEFGIQKVRGKLARIEERQGGQGVFRGDTGNIVSQAIEVGAFANPLTGPALVVSSGASQFITQGGRQEIDDISKSVSQSLNVDERIAKASFVGLTVLATATGGKAFTGQIEKLAGFPKFNSVFVARQVATDADRIVSRSAVLTTRKGLVSNRQFLSAIDTDLRVGQTVNQLTPFKAGSRGAFREIKGVDLVTKSNIFGQAKKFGSLSTGSIQQKDVSLLIGRTPGLDVRRSIDSGAIVRSISKTVTPSRLGTTKSLRAGLGVAGRIEDNVFFVGRTAEISIKSTGSKLLKRGLETQTGLIKEASKDIFNKRFIFDPSKNLVSVSKLPTQALEKSITQSAAQTAIKDIVLKENKISNIISKRISGATRATATIKPVQVVSPRTSLATSLRQSSLSGTTTRNLSANISKSANQTKQLSRPLSSLRLNQVSNVIPRQISLQRQGQRQIQRQRTTTRLISSRPTIPKINFKLPIVPLGLKRPRVRSPVRRRQSRRGIDNLFIVPSFTARVSGASIRIPKAKLPKIATKLQGIGLRPNVIITGNGRRRR